MVWNYLTNFWNQLTDVGSTTIAWFQGIGNAVAGAIGGFFDAIFHLMSDLFWFFGWIFASLKAIFLALITPFNFIFLFLKTFISQAFSTPTNAINPVLSPQIVEIFQRIPYWSILSSVLGGLVLVFVGFALIKSISTTL